VKIKSFTITNCFNTKNFGVPQNRERVYTVGHLRSRGRKQIFPLKGTDREDSVPVKIIGHRDGYLRNTQVFAPDGVTEALSTCQGGGREHHTIVPVQFKNIQGDEIQQANALTAKDRGVSNFKQTGTAVAIPVLTPDRPVKRQNGRRFKDNGDESFTLTAQDRHGVALKVKEATKQGYAIAHEGDSINLSIPGSKTRRGRVGNAVANTLDCKCEQAVFVKLSDDLTVYAVWYEKYQCYIAIRKLTPRECFRLQGWTDDYFEKAAFINSDSQLYKQAGNGVTVNVVQTIGEAIKEE
jgi:DNA (cytosine-5)-methyltransferase 1